jgi:hypothetical protein
MLDFNNILATPGADIQYFQGPATATVIQWQVWKKPRGARWIYMLGVGGGGGGSCGNAAANSTGGGGAGGSSGGQTTVMIPAMFVPDVLYIQAGAGGAGATTSAGFGTNGIATYVAIVPFTTLSPASTLLLANNGTVSATAPTTANGGLAPGAVAAATLAGMCLAGRGFTTLLTGQVGGAGGAANTVGPIVNLPTTGLMVTGGSGGGGVGSGQGGNIGTTGFLGTEFFPILQGSFAFSGQAGDSGFIARNFMMNYGGTGGGGGGGSSQGTAGSNGAPGCGGGGGGGASNSFPIIAPAGSGGPGFVYIITT